MNTAKKRCVRYLEDADPNSQFVANLLTQCLNLTNGPVQDWVVASWRDRFLELAHIIDKDRFYADFSILTIAATLLGEWQVEIRVANGDEILQGLDLSL